MKTFTPSDSIKYEDTVDDNWHKIYCNECAGTLNLADQLLDVGATLAALDERCSNCGKTQEEESFELAQDKIDDEEIVSDNLTPQDVYPTTVNVSAEDSSVFELKRQHEKGRINLAPKFQRHNVWTNKQKSELIESILMGIPLPIMYFFQNKEGVKQVIDGKQRLTTFFDFLDNKFSLSELPIMQNLKGKKFNDLSPLQQGKIEDYKISINVIKPPTPDRIKFDIFDRVNRGGTRLNNQEMRNAIYQGKGTELLESLKDSESFKKATDYSIRSRVMKDRYMILRFLAFYLWRKRLLMDTDGTHLEYKSDIDSFLGKAMEFLNSCSEEQLEKFEHIFETSMTNAYVIMGKDGFRVSNYLEKDRRTSVSMALFEALAYLFSFEEVEINHVVTRDEVQKLLQDEEFLSSITSPVDSSTKVNKRFAKIEQILGELLC